VNAVRHDRMNIESAERFESDVIRSLLRIDF
jgi:hypothetical protein